ncbi:MAG: hypothetical protein JKY34_14945 [Kordiimonadaceae bacterium]|nr:hypothetical protein [Kordiimonadaceae bacterium]
MVIKECIFRGFIVACDCGKDFHVAYNRIQKETCACGKPCKNVAVEAEKTMMARSTSSLRYV